MEAHRHRLQVQVPDAPVRVAGDRKRLVQVLTNLLDNAAKYTPPGGLVEVFLDRDDRTATLRVRDNGQGVPPELHERIFDLFVQGQRGADRAQGGLGVGLALARRLVQLHGGSLDCASDGAGRGSEFRLRLPLETSAPESQAAPDDVAPDLREAGALRIFIVDDNEDASHMLAMLLEGAGHAVATEADPVVALERIQAARPDVCLLDIGLPRMDGHELARRLRATAAGQAATLVALTGYGQPADREVAARAGFDHYLVKPPQPDALARLLASVAAQRPHAQRA
jgi:CheY-like chemotaxis protein